MKIVLMSTQVGEASDELQAMAILDNADYTPIGDSFVRVAAVELAKRLLPEYDQTESAGQAPRGNRSQGLAPASAMESRINQAFLESATATEFKL